MKAIYLSPITKIEEVLDLITDPEKYVQYLKDLKDAHAEVEAALGTLKTKKEAEGLLAQAFDASEFATKLREDVQNEIKTQREQLRQDLEVFNKEVAEKREELRDREKNIEQKRVEVEQVRALLSAQQTSFSDYVGTKEKALAEQQEKLTAALNDVSEKKAKAEAALKAWS